MSDSENYSSSSDDDSSTTSVELVCSNRSCLKEFSSSSDGCSASRKLCAECNNDVIQQSKDLLQADDDDADDDADDELIVAAGCDDFCPTSEEEKCKVSTPPPECDASPQLYSSADSAQDEEQTSNVKETNDADDDAETMTNHVVAIAALFKNLDTSISFDVANRCVTFVRKKFKGDALRRTPIVCYLDNELEDRVDPMFNFISIGVHYNKSSKVRMVQ